MLHPVKSKTLKSTATHWRCLMIYTANANEYKARLSWAPIVNTEQGLTTTGIKSQLHEKCSKFDLAFQPIILNPVVDWQLKQNKFICNEDIKG